MTTADYIRNAYDITDRMSVTGGAVEQMAALRQALREAYKAAKESEQSKEGETHDD